MRIASAALLFDFEGALSRLLDPFETLEAQRRVPTQVLPGRGGSAYT